MLRLAMSGALLVVACAAAPSEWSPAERATLRDMGIADLGRPPNDPTNRFADDKAAAALGKKLFNDTRFSANGRISCASCHRADYGLTDNLPLGRGIGTAGRRTMPIAAASYAPWQFWDGRADSLWAQALGPVENPVEHGSNRVQVAAKMVDHYAEDYRIIFGAAPDLSDETRFPRIATPVGSAAANAAWANMEPRDRRTVDQTFVNFGKAIAAFERTIPLPRTRFDNYVEAATAGRQDDGSLSHDERAGLKLFIGKARCVECHSGPLLTNHDFANTGVPEPESAAPDDGRLVGVQKALADPFNCHGSFSDARDNCDELDFAATKDPELIRAFKVPSLRGVASRPPYMHAGQFRTLGDVLDHYNTAPAAPRGTSRLRKLHLTKTERVQLIAFLKALDPIQ